MADQIRSIVGAYAEEQLKFDPFTHAVTTIAQQHRLLHDGFFFVTSGKQTAWATATSKLFLLRVPALVFPHVQTMKLSFGRGDIDFEAFEGATVSATGTALPLQNPNRNSTNTPDLELYAEPTVTDDGTSIFTLWTPPTAAGVGQSANGVEGVGQGSEWILKAGTDYIVRMTNNSGALIDWSYEFAWYEVGYVLNDRVEVP